MMIGLTMRSVTWNRSPIKKFVIDSLLLSLVEWSYVNTDMRKFESLQKDESRAQSTDSSKAGVYNLLPIAGRITFIYVKYGRQWV